MQNFAEFRSKIPANKFYPPRVESSQCLYRKNLVENVLRKKGLTKQAIIVEAQAGQGKTTLIIQYLEHINAPYGWYQIGPEDSDPVLLLKSLFAGISNTLPGFSAPLFEEMITHGEIATSDMNHLANLLLADLDAFLQENFYLVFDDLHLLKHDEASSSLLNYIFTTAPPRIHFILASRQPVQLTGKHLKYNRQLLRLINQDLSMSERDISDLYSDIFHIPASPELVQKIHKATDGWTMGIILAAHDLEKHQARTPEKSRVFDLTISQGAMLDYFRQEIFLQLPKKLRHPFLLLSFLDDIPVELARRITGLSDIDQVLKKIVSNNFFVRRLDADNNIFGFHHLFQEFLQERAGLELDKEEINTVLRSAAQFSLEKGKPGSALRYLLKAGDFDAMEKILAEDGMDFLARNQTATLDSILQNIPAEVILKRGWFSLFSGLIVMDSQPEKVKAYLERAIELFEENNGGVGELLAISNLLHYHNVTSGVYKEGAQYLDKATALFEQHSETLSDYAKIVIAKNLATGFIFFIADFEKGYRFSSLAMELARKHDAVNFQAAVLLIQGYQQMLTARLNICLEKLEQAQTLIHLPQIGAFNMMALRFFQVNYLIQYGGDFINYFNQKSIIMDIVGREFIKQSLPGLFFYLFDMDIALSREQNDRVVELANEALATDSKLLSPHLKSQILHYQALGLALTQQKDKALAAADESLKLRQSVGGPYYVVKNKLCIAAAYGLFNDSGKALQLLTEAIEEAKTFQNHNEMANGYLYRAYFLLQEEEKNEAYADLHKGLQLLRQHRYVHMLNWVPLLMKPLLVVAVKENIEADYARTLAVQKMDLAILDNGETIPLLQLKTLGGLRVLLGEETIITSEELTPAQRDLMALLIASPNLKISQEKVQAALWPDSPPEKARKKFDTLLSRCRKILTKAIKPHAASNYLNLQKGILCLKNCRVDAIEFIKQVKKGMQHSRYQRLWQAGNSFYLASHMWQGLFAPNVVGNEDVRNLRDELLMRFVEMSLKWAETLKKFGNKTEAIAVITKALQYDRTNDLLVRKLYQLHSQNPAIQSQQVIKQYIQALLAEGYLPDEVEELVDDIVS